MKRKIYILYLLIFCVITQPIVANPATLSALSQMLNQLFYNGFMALAAHDSSMKGIKERLLHVKIMQKEVVEEKQVIGLDWEALRVASPYSTAILKKTLEQQWAGIKVPKKGFDNGAAIRSVAEEVIAYVTTTEAAKISAAINESIAVARPTIALLPIQHTIDWERVRDAYRAKQQPSLPINVGITLRNVSRDFPTRMQTQAYLQQLTKEHEHTAAYIQAVHEIIGKLLHAHKHVLAWGEQIYAFLDAVNALHTLREEQKNFRPETANSLQDFIVMLEKILPQYVNEHGDLVNTTGTPYSLEELRGGLEKVINNEYLQELLKKIEYNKNLLTDFDAIAHKAKQMHVHLPACSAKTTTRNVRGIVQKTEQNKFNKQLLKIRELACAHQFEQAKHIVDTIAVDYGKHLPHHQTAEQCYKYLRNLVYTGEGILKVCKDDPLWASLAPSVKKATQQDKAVLKQMNQVLMVRHKLKEQIIKEYGLRNKTTKELDEFLYTLVDCRTAHDVDLEVTFLMALGVDLEALGLERKYYKNLHQHFFLPNGLLRRQETINLPFVRSFKANPQYKEEDQITIRYYANKLLALKNNTNKALFEQGISCLHHANTCAQERDKYLVIVNNICAAMEGNKFYANLLKGKEFLAHQDNSVEHQDELTIVDYIIVKTIEHEAKTQGLLTSELVEVMQRDDLYLANGIHARHSDRPFVQSFKSNTKHTKELQEKIVATANKVLDLLDTHKEKQAPLQRALRYLKHANSTADLKEAEAFTTLAHALAKAVEGSDPFYKPLVKEKDFLSDFTTVEDYKKNIEHVLELAEMFDAYQELTDLIYKNDAGSAPQPGNNQIPSNNNQQSDPNHDPNDPLSPGHKEGILLSALLAEATKDVDRFNNHPIVQQLGIRIANAWKIPYHFLHGNLKNARIVTGLHSKILDCCFKLNRVKDYGMEFLAQKEYLGFSDGRTSTVSPWSHRQFINNFLNALEKGNFKDDHDLKKPLRIIKATMDCCGRIIEFSINRATGKVSTYYIQKDSLETVAAAGKIYCDCVK